MNAGPWSEPLLRLYDRNALVVAMPNATLLDAPESAAENCAGGLADRQKEKNDKIGLGPVTSQM